MPRASRPSTTQYTKSRSCDHILHPWHPPSHLLGGRSVVNFPGGTIQSAVPQDALFLAACKNTASGGRLLPVWDAAASDGIGYNYGKSLIAQTSGNDSHKHALVIYDQEGNRRYAYYVQDPTDFDTPDEDEVGDLAAGGRLISSVANNRNYNLRGNKQGTIYVGSFAAATDFRPHPMINRYIPGDDAPDINLPFRTITLLLQEYAKQENLAAIWAVVVDSNRRAKLLWRHMGVNVEGGSTFLPESQDQLNAILMWAEDGNASDGADQAGATPSGGGCNKDDPDDGHNPDNCQNVTLVKGTAAFDDTQERDERDYRREVGGNNQRMGYRDDTTPNPLLIPVTASAMDDDYEQHEERDDSEDQEEYEEESSTQDEEAVVVHTHTPDNPATNLRTEIRDNGQNRSHFSLYQFLRLTREFMERGIARARSAVVWLLNEFA